MTDSPPDLAEVLDKIGIGFYEQVLRENGFDDWPTLMDITDEDMEGMGFKLGHRRKLQREIANARGGLKSASTTSPPAPGATATLPPPPSNPSKRKEERGEGKTSKRRYRRHPKPDPNAPKRPKTAYVNFAEYVRSDPAISALSFVEIARIVGRRWQEMDAHERLVKWEEPASLALQAYENQMEYYKLTPEYRAHQTYLEDFRAKHGSNSIRHAGASSASSGPQHGQDQSPTTYSDRSEFEDPDGGSEHSRYAIDEAIGELSALLVGPTAEYQTFDTDNPPPEESVRNLVKCFSEGTDSFFFVYPWVEIGVLVDAIYKPQEQTDEWALLDVLAMAAVGSYYDKSVSRELTRYLRCMRLFVCLSFYRPLEEPSRSRNLVRAAIQIGRAELHRRGVGEAQYYDVKAYWGNVLRTALNIECWLTYTVGYGSSLATTEELDYACRPTEGGGGSVEDCIQVHSVKLSRIAAGIAMDFVSRKDVFVDYVRHHMERLEAWHRELPQSMHLSTLTGEGSNEYTDLCKRSIMLIHMLFLGAVTLLHRKLLVAVAEYHLVGTWTLRDSYEEVCRYQDYCVVTAYQIARIAAILRADGSRPRQCWVAVNPTFNACSILLYSASQKVLNSSYHKLEEDLEAVNHCLTLLIWCDGDGITQRYLEILRPIHSKLVDICKGNSPVPIPIPQRRMSEDSAYSSQMPGDVVTPTTPASSISPLTSSNLPPTPSSTIGYVLSERGQPTTTWGRSLPPPLARERQELRTVVHDILQLLRDPFVTVHNIDRVVYHHHHVAAESNAP